ncbi:MAG: tRNA lysidine(34) synthetase TilS [Thermomicrobiales bacterium]
MPKSADRCRSVRAFPRAPLGLEQRLLSRAIRAGITCGDHLIIAFSAGRDSLALAAASRWLVQRIEVAVTLVHIDHRLRHSSSAEAQQAVELASSLGLPIVVREILGGFRDRHPGVGLEEAARRERYRLLFEVAHDFGAKVIATAHHQQDQAETVLLHLLRGSGLHGAAGMAEWRHLDSVVTMSDISQKQSNILIWRPLLHEEPSQITTYIERLGLHPIIDPSNTDHQFRRNAVRHQALPLLEDLASGAVAALARYADIAAEEDQFLDLLARAALDAARDSVCALRVDRLLAEPRALQCRMIRLWIGEAADGLAPSFNRLAAVLDLARHSASGREIEIGEGWTVRRSAAMLHLRGEQPTGKRTEEDADGR